jgi:hypothetical protein
MKRSTTRVLFYLAVLSALTAQTVFGQSAGTSAPRSNQDRMMQELLNEVRQLRVAVQRMTLNAHRGQVLVERLRVQQQQVSRLTQQLNDTRMEMADAKAALAARKQSLEEAGKKKEAGVLDVASYDEAVFATEELIRREQVLAEREIQLSNELNTEQAGLVDLNRRLDALEREMIVTIADEETKSKPRKR